MRPVVAHFIDSLSSGGAEKLLTDLLPLHEKLGIATYLVVSNSKYSFSRHLNFFELHGIKIVFLERNIYNPLIIFDLFILTKYLKVNIWHAHLFPSQSWLAITSFFLSSNVKYVKTEHALTNRRFESRLFTFFDRFFYKRYSRIIAISRDISCVLINKIKIKQEKIQLILNGVNINQIKNFPTHPEVIFNHDFYNILMVARFDKWQKDHKSLINSFIYLPANVRIYFVGVGPMLGEMIDYVNSKDKNSIFFLGLRDDVYALMKTCDLNILISNFEGLSGVVLEALASGRPSIGSDVSGIRDIVPDKRFLIPSNNPKTIAEHIVKVKSDSKLAENMAIDGLKFIETFDISKMANDYNYLYSKLLGCTR